MLSDTLSLVVFAICVSTYTTGFSTSAFVLQIVEIAVFVPFVLLGISRLGAYLLKTAEALSSRAVVSSAPVAVRTAEIVRNIRCCAFRISVVLSCWPNARSIPIGRINEFPQN